MSDNKGKVAMPGDADAPLGTGDQGEKSKATTVKREAREMEADKADTRDTNIDAKRVAERKAELAKNGENEDGTKGPLTPAQFEGDGWAGTPVQMRGEDKK